MPFSNASVLIRYRTLSIRHDTLWNADLVPLRIEIAIYVQLESTMVTRAASSLSLTLRSSNLPATVNIESFSYEQRCCPVPAAVGAQQFALDSRRDVAST